VYFWAVSKPPSGATYLGGCALVLAAGVSTFRLWKGKTVSPLNKPEAERGLSFVLVAFLPLTAFLAAVLVAALATQAASHFRSSLPHALMLVVVVVASAVALSSALLTLSVLAWRKPGKVIPPHMRRSDEEH
jgi:hypothetical protein